MHNSQLIRFRWNQLNERKFEQIEIVLQQVENEMGKIVTKNLTVSKLA